MKKSYALLTVFVAILIDLLGFGIVLPLLPFYATTFHASPFVIGLLYSIYSFAQLIFSPIWGSFSDRIGRRPIMLLSTFGAILAYILFGLAQSLTVLFLSRFIAGVMGGNVSAAQAYIADITTEEDRARGMGLIGAAYGIGFVIGPAIGALLISPWFKTLFHIPEATQYMMPGFVAAGLSSVSFLLVLFKLPETVNKSAGKPARSYKRLSVFTGHFWRHIFSMNTSGFKGLFAMLLGCLFLFSFSQSGLYSAFPLFCKSRIGLLADQVGLLFAFMGLIVIIIQGGLIRVLVKRFSEERLFFAGSLIATLGYSLLAFSTSVWGLMAVMGLLGIGWSLSGPTLSSLISKEADPSEVGAVMGSSQGISALGRVIGPAWGGSLFTVSFWLPFAATAVLLGLTGFVGLKLLFIEKMRRQRI